MRFWLLLVLLLTVTTQVVGGGMASLLSPEADGVESSLQSDTDDVDNDWVPQAHVTMVVAVVEVEREGDVVRKSLVLEAGVDRPPCWQAGV